jgi:hypothetical protein
LKNALVLFWSKTGNTKKVAFAIKDGLESAGLAKFDAYKKQEKIKKGSPTIQGKYALIFCTYSGPHTGLREATPAVLYGGQFFEHLGFTVLGEWCVLSEFPGSEELSTQGRMGDIRGKPTPEDLEKIKSDTKQLVCNLYFE